MTRKQKRLAVIGGLGAVVLTAVAMIAIAFQSTFSFFLTPSQLQGHQVQDGRAFRLGGLVEAGSCARQGDELMFRVTDGEGVVSVTYRGIVPDLFREGQGVIADGRLEGEGFVADTVLAKHDENYIPREIADELKQRGEWYGDGDAPAAQPAGANPCRPGAA